MAQYCITRTRIIKLNIPETYKMDKMQLGIPVVDDEAALVGLTEVGEVVLPSGRFGSQSRRNAYGYSYADKTKPKAPRYVSTNWIYPFGNTNASMVASDVYRNCYPKIDVEPYGIELQLYENEDNQQFVIVNMTDEIREKYVKEAINLMLEIYGKCYVYDGVIDIEKGIKRKRCNWEILPPGELPSRHVEKQLKAANRKTHAYDVERLNYIEMYNASTVVEGINGFKGYYAYLYERYCVLESAMYGNATYIIPIDNWEILSQRTKKELLDENHVVGKITHNEKWKWNIKSVFQDLGIKKKIGQL